jgi:multidrug efflux system outer membrane protein
MLKKLIYKTSLLVLLGLSFEACKVPEATLMTPQKDVPETYNLKADSALMQNVPWREFFDDPFLVDLIDSALNRNQELNIILAEMEMAKSEVLEKEGEYKPFVGLGGAAGAEKVGRYTSQGASDANTEIDEGKGIS